MESADIVVVEDEAILREELTDILLEMGHRVPATFKTGKAVINYTAQYPPDLILMDIQLKGEMDGIDTAEIIHRDFHIPIIFITAYADQEKLKRARFVLPYGFILKPIQERDLKVSIDLALYAAEADRQRRRSEAELKRSLAQTTRKAEEMEALLIAARSVLKYRNFEEAARRIFDQARTMTGAASGYVALLSDDGSENEVLFLEAGGLPCTVDPGLPMPIRGLREVAYRTGKAVMDNHFTASKWMRYMPPGHVSLRNVMFAPLNLDGQTRGLMGLANKPVDFTEADLELATAFGDIAAIALDNALLLEKLGADR